MSILNVTGSVTNASGTSSQFTGTINVVDAPIIDSVVISPTSGPSGTLFTITINAHDPNTPPQTPLSYVVKVNNVNATPTAQPNVFTWQA